MQRSQVGVIIRRTKGFFAFLQKADKVVTQHHVMNIETLSEEKNSQLQRLLKFKHKVKFPTSAAAT